MPRAPVLSSGNVGKSEIRRTATVGDPWENRTRDIQLRRLLPHVIKAENITRIYESGGVKVKALDNVSLEINRGEFLIITGRNGSGKSTLLHQLALLDVPNSGEIYIDGQKTVHFC